MREEKQLLLDEVKEKIEKSEGFIVTRYEGFDGGAIRAFRDRIAEANGEFEVVKKRIFVKAALETGLQFEIEALKGHVGLVFAKEELLSVLKAVLKHGEERVQVLGGQVDGAVCAGDDLIAMSKLPPLPELRAQFAGLLEASMGQTIAVMQSLLAGLISCVEQKSKKDN